jgi:hypothetical protein
MNESKIENGQPTLQQHNVSSSFIQSEKTRRPNGLNFKMRELFNKGKLTQWEYSQYKHFVRSYAKVEGLYYDEIDEQLFERVQS